MWSAHAKQLGHTFPSKYQTIAHYCCMCVANSVCDLVKPKLGTPVDPTWQYLWLRYNISKNQAKQNFKMRPSNSHNPKITKNYCWVFWIFLPNFNFCPLLPPFYEQHKFPIGKLAVPVHVSNWSQGVEISAPCCLSLCLTVGPTAALNSLCESFTTASKLALVQILQKFRSHSESGSRHCGLMLSVHCLWTLIYGTFSAPVDYDGWLRLTSLSNSGALVQTLLLCSAFISSVAKTLH